MVSQEKSGVTKVKVVFKYRLFLDYTPNYNQGQQQQQQQQHQQQQQQQLQQQQQQQQHTTAQHIYRGTPAPVTIQTTINEEKIPQRNSAHVSTRYNTQAQDIYQHATLPEYTDDNYQVCTTGMKGRGELVD